MCRCDRIYLCAQSARLALRAPPNQRNNPPTPLIYIYIVHIRNAHNAELASYSTRRSLLTVRSLYTRMRIVHKHKYFHYRRRRRRRSRRRRGRSTPHHRLQQRRRWRRCNRIRNARFVCEPPTAEYIDTDGDPLQERHTDNVRARSHAMWGDMCKHHARPPHDCAAAKSARRLFVL